MGLYSDEIHKKISQLERSIGYHDEDGYEKVEEIKNYHRELEEFEYLKFYLRNHQGLYDIQHESITSEKKRAINDFFKILFGPLDREINYIRMMKERIFESKMDILSKIFAYLDYSDINPNEKVNDIYSSLLGHRKKYLKYDTTDGILDETYLVEANTVSGRIVPRTETEGYIDIQPIFYMVHHLFSREEIINKIKSIFYHRMRTSGNYHKTELYEYILKEYPGSTLEENLSKEDFREILKKYLFFEVVDGNEHLHTDTRYLLPFGIKREKPQKHYEDEEEYDYYDEYDEYDSKTFKHGIEFFECCYFLPDILVERVNIILDEFLSIPKLVDTLYMWSSWSYYLSGISLYDSKEKKSIQYTEEDYLENRIPNNPNVLYHYCCRSGSYSTSCSERPETFGRKNACRRPIIRIGIDMREESKSYYMEYLLEIDIRKVKINIPDRWNKIVPKHHYRSSYW